MAVSRLAGALIVMIGAWLLGRSFSLASERELKRLELLRRCLDELRYEVTKLETPLPELLARLEREAELTGENYVPPETGDFQSRWRAFSAALALEEEVRQTVAELGESLSRSHEPEKCFALAEQRLTRAQTALEQRCEERKRLGAPLLKCVGVLLALLLW